MSNHLSLSRLATVAAGERTAGGFDRVYGVAALAEESAQRSQPCSADALRRDRVRR